VIPDYRPPNIVRLAPSPLYIGFEDCLRAIEKLHVILETGEYLTYTDERGLVA
jgi:kynureninase